MRHAVKVIKRPGSWHFRQTSREHFDTSGELCLDINEQSMNFEGGKNFSTDVLFLWGRGKVATLRTPHNQVPNLPQRLLQNLQSVGVFAVCAASTRLPCLTLLVELPGITPNTDPPYCTLWASAGAMVVVTPFLCFSITLGVFPPHYFLFPSSFMKKLSWIIT